LDGALSTDNGLQSPFDGRRARKARIEVFGGGTMSEEKKLTDGEVAELHKRIADLEAENEELAEANFKLKMLYDFDKGYRAGLMVGREQVVKDTAKEILLWLIEHTFESSIFETYFRERFGVEVE
jgi:hypothetical protein